MRAARRGERVGFEKEQGREDKGELSARRKGST
jgi:hypothetical protein